MLLLALPYLLTGTCLLVKLSPMAQVEPLGEHPLRVAPCSQYCGTRAGTAGTATFCLSETGTGTLMHSGSGSLTGF